MARPQKNGLDYFPFDVGLPKDPKLRKLRLKHGYVAVMVYISLLSLLYRDKGYYIDYGDKDNVIWEVSEDLQGKYQPTAETIAEIIEDLVACELFSGDQFKSKIITSKRSQSTYYSATVGRKMVNIIDGIWLLSLEDMKKLSVKHCYYLERVKQPNNEVNQSENEVNQSDNPQSKVNETKVNEIRVKETKEEEYAAAASFLEQNFCKTLSTAEILSLYEAIDGFGSDIVKVAISETVLNGVRAWKYTQAILDRWKDAGIKTVEQAQAQTKQRVTPQAAHDDSRADGKPHPDGGIWYNGKQMLGVTPK